MLKQILKLYNAQRFCLVQGCILLGAKHPECMVSVFSDISSGHVDLFLTLTDNF